jgi:GNAT superfamily N-acetyltransferase
MTAFAIEEIGAAAANEAVPSLAKVLMDCVEGGASVGFMAPLSRERAEAFWRRAAEGVEGGEVALFVAREATGDIVGTVQLRTGVPENQPHRADVAKMLVHRRARRQGIAEALLAELEAAALRRGRWLLVLDTVSGGDAERLYRRLGWQVSGMIPDNALFPDGRPCGTTVMWKSLAARP